MTDAVILAEAPLASAPVIFLVALDKNILSLSAMPGPLVVRAASLVGARAVFDMGAVPLPYLSDDTMIIPIEP